MWKRFSARSKLLASVLGLGLSGCDVKGLGDQGEQQFGPTRPGQVLAAEEVGAVASAEPGRTPRQWRPADPGARRATGTLTTSLESLRSGPLVLAFANGITLRLERMGQMPAAERMGVGAQSFAKALGLHEEAPVRIYRVLREEVDPVAPDGGLCRKQPTAYVAAAEYIGPEGEWAFRTGSFAGEVEPGAGGDPQFCGAFSYSLAP